MASYLLDLDGTMYQGTKLIPAAKILIDSLLASNQAFYFLTNNAARTPQENVEHMLNMGYQGIKADMFFNSAMACVSYTKRNYPGNKVLMVGENGLRTALEEANYQLVSKKANIVMVGLNRRGDYALYSQALQNLLAGATFMATNADRVLLSEKGTLLGNGSVVAMLEYASGQKAIVTGKPNAIILEEALAYWNLKKEEVVIVGDNLETDILCGLNAGVTTVLVLSGVHNETDCQRLKIYPSRIISSLEELI